jgi:hypothetical protein
MQVLMLVCATSEKYVPEPGKIDILSDVIIGLRRFSNSCRWKEFLRLKKLEEARESALSPKSVDCEDFFESEMIEVTKREGLNSNLKAKDKTKQVPKDSNNLEAFLSAVENFMDPIFNDVNGYKPNP